MRPMADSLLQSIDKVSDINKKISQIDKKELEDKFIDNMRSMTTLLSQHTDKVSDIDKKTSQIDKKEQKNNKISQIELIKKFFNIYKFCNEDLNKFALLLRKGVHPYEYMDSWEKFNEESLADKEYFYSKLNKENITDEEYAHAQKVWDTFKIKNLGEYHNLYVQSDTLLLADVFESFRDKCIEIYELDPAHF